MYSKHFDCLRNAGELVGGFANALDALRDRNYSSRSNLYGSIDLLPVAAKWG
ncbi:hypothetical protein [Sphingomonas sp. Root241]|uniref:hypothetical protein n=1 Tax=Sphingomonas sp. Root241 TaxID=1736501 RepID=UPI000A8A8CEC|nr:hypothetical protein [Sphingomonas sp. Root241]